MYKPFARSSSSPMRRALLDERPDALVGVFGTKADRLGSGFVAERLLKRKFERSIEGLLGEELCDGSPSEETDCQFPGPGKELILVDEIDA